MNNFNIVEKLLKKAIDDFNINENYESLRKIFLNPFISNIINKLDLEKIDIDFVININQSNFIKSLLDEKYEHYVRDRNMLESSINGVYDVYYYESNLDKLSEIFYRIIKNHPFNNGNKRTAIFSIRSFIIMEMLRTSEESLINHYNLLKKEIMKKENINKIWKSTKKQFSQNFIKNSIKEFFNSKLVLSKLNDNNYTIIENELVSSWKKTTREDYKLALKVANSKTKEKDNMIELIKINLLYSIIIELPFIKEKTIKTEDFIKEQISNKNLNNFITKKSKNK